MLRFVAFDMDGTLVDNASSWRSVHDHFGEQNEEGLRAFLDHRIDDHEFVASDIRIWWRHAPRITVFDLERILADVPLMAGARPLLAALHERGIRTAIVSGGIDVLAKRVGRELGIDYVLANGFRTDSDGRLTGEGIVRVPIRSKEEVLAGIQEQLGMDPSDTASVGNSDIDIGLFRRSRVGVAFRPVDQAVRDAATAVVEDGDLTQVLDALLSPAEVEPTSPKSRSQPS